MARQANSVKRYVVKLSEEERRQLEGLLRKGKSPAQRLLKARILLKADVSDVGEGWSDSRIVTALETSLSMVYRVRKQLVEEGLEPVLSRKPRDTPAVPRIFDGEKEAKLIALGTVGIFVLGALHLVFESFAEDDGELCFCLGPFTWRSLPLLRQMIEHEV